LLLQVSLNCEKERGKFFDWQDARATPMARHTTTDKEQDFHAEKDAIYFFLVFTLIGY
jgi:hypothetical protein